MATVFHWTLSVTMMMTVGTIVMKQLQPVLTKASSATMKVTPSVTMETVFFVAPAAM